MVCVRVGTADHVQIDELCRALDRLVANVFRLHERVSGAVLLRAPLGVLVGSARWENEIAPVRRKPCAVTGRLPPLGMSVAYAPSVERQPTAAPAGLPETVAVLAKSGLAIGALSASTRASVPEATDVLGAKLMPELSPL